MKSFLFGSVVAAALASASLAFADTRNPVGEVGNFTVDTTSGRTTGLVKSGTLATTITDKAADGFKMTIAYDFHLAFLGEKTGTELVGVPPDYYTPEFWTKLRETKHFESAEFKVDWLATEDASTMTGQTYANCDKVHIYDIHINSAFARVARALLGVPEAATLDNLDLVADIYQGVPALGAVKMDGTAQYSGMNVKFGADYQP